MHKSVLAQKFFLLLLFRRESKDSVNWFFPLSLGGNPLPGCMGPDRCPIVTSQISSLLYSLPVSDVTQSLFHHSEQGRGRESDKRFCAIALPRAILFLSPQEARIGHAFGVLDTRLRNIFTQWQKQILLRERERERESENFRQWREQCIWGGCWTVCVSVYTRVAGSTSLVSYENTAT